MNNLYSCHMCEKTGPGNTGWLSSYHMGHSACCAVHTCGGPSSATGSPSCWQTAFYILVVGVLSAACAFQALLTLSKCLWNSLTLPVTSASGLCTGMLSLCLLLGKLQPVFVLLSCRWEALVLCSWVYVCCSLAFDSTETIQET